MMAVPMTGIGNAASTTAEKQGDEFADLQELRSGLNVHVLKSLAVSRSCWLRLLKAGIIGCLFLYHS